ncbi:uncharacterized protein LOC135371952 [Ornithodoros turicata]|uniref:uncharacterized protein LOC135371952 n=1 Tax=Ornithodoros turicata TaxID=34597 RepID=UPI003138EB80
MQNFVYRHSIVLLALVDHRYRFLYINVGSPGRCHDAFVYHRSSLAKCVEGPLFKTPVAKINRTAVPPLILCDQAFPLTPHLVKPFSHRAHVNDEKKQFNYHLSNARGVVENAFGRMKARFRYTMKRMECDMENAPLVIRTCCVLNSICEHFNEPVMQQWTTELHATSAPYAKPQGFTDVRTGNGDAVRDAIVQYYKRRPQVALPKVHFPGVGCVETLPQKPPFCQRCLPELSSASGASPFPCRTLFLQVYLALRLIIQVPSGASYVFSSCFCDAFCVLQCFQAV